MKFNPATRAALATLFVSSLIACAKTEPHLGATITTVDNGDGVAITQAESRRLLPNGKIAGDEATLIQVESTVSKIDQTARTFTLKTTKGETVDLVAGPEIRNFSQIRKGDRVNAQYLVSLAFEVRKPTEQELAVSGKAMEAGARARLGAMPAAGAVSGNIRVATVEAIDKSAATVTLRGVNSDGLTVIKARFPENLNYVKAGDSVVISTVEAVATGVSRLP